jgi:hypothetical protein
MPNRANHQPHPAAGPQAARSITLSREFTATNQTKLPLSSNLTDFLNQKSTGKNPLSTKFRPPFDRTSTHHNPLAHGC